MSVESADHEQIGAATIDGLRPHGVTINDADAKSAVVAEITRAQRC